MVIGLGGVGSHAASMILRAGVGRLLLVDFDQVTSVYNFVLLVIIIIIWFFFSTSLINLVNCSSILKYIFMFCIIYTSLMPVGGWIVDLITRSQLF